MAEEFKEGFLAGVSESMDALRASLKNASKSARDPKVKALAVMLTHRLTKHHELIKENINELVDKYQTPKDIHETRSESVDDHGSGGLVGERLASVQTS